VKIEEVSEVTLPAQVKAWMRTFRIAVSFGLGALPSFLACLGLPGFYARLLFWFIAPIVAVLLALVASVGYITWSVGSSVAIQPKRVLKFAAPILLRLLFILYPIVTNAAFEAFSCYEFDNATRAYLVVDVTIECSTPWAGTSHSDEHMRVTALAFATVAVYPVGLLLLNGYLLFSNRNAIEMRKPNSSSQAISFLWQEYERTFFWWELMEMTRRLVLVGLFVLISRGSITQLVIGTAFCAIFMAVQMQAWPYRDTVDDYVANACSFALLAAFVCCLMFKVASLSELPDVMSSLSVELQQDFKVNDGFLTLLLGGCVLGVLVVSSFLMASQLARERVKLAREARFSSARRLRYKDTRQEVLATVIDKHGFHLFLSHVWGTGQDQMRVVKQRLLEMIPDLHVFLDVDDLKEIGDLEKYVDQTKVVLTYCSRGYFDSRNCMRELCQAVRRKKPMIALIDPDVKKGGLSIDEVRRQLLGLQDNLELWGLVYSARNPATSDADPPPGHPLSHPPHVRRLSFLTGAMRHRIHLPQARHNGRRGDAPCALACALAVQRWSLQRHQTRRGQQQGPRLPRKFGRHDARSWPIATLIRQTIAQTRQSQEPLARCGTQADRSGQLGAAYGR